jgi:hypothetical protein
MAHYRFDNLLGAPYRGGNLCVRGTKLLTSIGNRVTEVDLTLSSCATLPSENLTEIQCVAVSPSGSHMISFDTDGRAILVNLRCVRGKGRARTNAFGSFLSPDSKTNSKTNRAIARDVSRHSATTPPRAPLDRTQLGPCGSRPDEARAEDDTTHEYHIRC